MNRQTLMMLFGINHYAITRNLEKLTHEESLRRPAPAGNSLNWVLGHVVATRQVILKILGQEPVWTDAMGAPYVRGSDGLADPGRAMRLEAIVEALDSSQERIVAGLERISEADLAASLASQGVEGNLAGLHFHEAYHAGQLGLLRRLSGKPGAIR